MGKGFLHTHHLRALREALRLFPVYYRHLALRWCNLVGRLNLRLYNGLNKVGGMIHAGEGGFGDGRYLRCMI